MSEALHPIIQARHSARAIDASRQVEPEKIAVLLEAARWAPSCANNQPWQYIMINKQSLPEIKECLSRGNAWAKNAPVIMAVASKADLGCRRNEREYFALDLGLSIENMLLQGIDMGLVMHPIAGFDEDGVKHVIEAPEEYRVFVLIIIGYPGSINDLDEITKQKESAPRTRKPFNEIVFWEKWNHSSEGDRLNTA